MHCKTHPKYKGKLLPRIVCPGCWFIYMRWTYPNSFNPNKYVELEHHDRR